MRTRWAALSGLVAIGLLETGCWSSYLVDSQLLAAGKQRAQAAGKGSIIAVPAVDFPLEPSDAAIADRPYTYVRAEGLHVDHEIPGAKYQVAWARRPRAFRIGGGVTLGIGLASLIGGAIGAAVVANTPCPPYTPHENCGLGNAIGAILIGAPAGVFGLLETVIGGTLLGLGAQRNQLGPSEPYTVYLPPSGSPAPSAPSAPSAPASR